MDDGGLLMLCRDVADEHSARPGTLCPTCGTDAPCAALRLAQEVQVQVLSR